MRVIHSLQKYSKIPIQHILSNHEVCEHKYHIVQCLDLPSSQKYGHKLLQTDAFGCISTVLQIQTKLGKLCWVQIPDVNESRNVLQDVDLYISVHGKFCIQILKNELNLYCEGETYLKKGIFQKHIKLILNFLSLIIYMLPLYDGSCDRNVHHCFGEVFAGTIMPNTSMYKMHMWRQP